MTPHLPVVRAEDIVRIALKLKFKLDRQKGSHAVYYRDSDKSRVVIPMHKGKTIKPKTLSAIIQDMGISVEEFRNLL